MNKPRTCEWCGEWSVNERHIEQCEAEVFGWSSPALPPGYWLDDVTDPDMPALISPNGRTVAVFTSRADPLEVEAVADEDNERVDAQIEEVERLLGRRAE